MGRGQTLDHTITAFERIFGAARDNHPEPRRDHIQTLRYVLADQHRSLAGMFGEFLRLDHQFDALKMRREPLAWPGWALFIRDLALANLRPKSRDAGFDLLKDESVRRPPPQWAWFWTGTALQSFRMAMFSGSQPIQTGSLPTLLLVSTST